jgi:hypothetical protein
MVEPHKCIFGTEPKCATPVLVKNDHPEINQTEFLDQEQTNIYQSLVGSLQWVIQIGRFRHHNSRHDHVLLPHGSQRRPHGAAQAHLWMHLQDETHHDPLKMDEPDYSRIPKLHHSWENTTHCGATELLPSNAPRTLGCHVVTTHHVDANLCHNLVTGKSVTGVLHVANQTHIDSFSKLQSTIETATHRSEFIATKACTEQIIDIWTTFCYLGVPIEMPAMMFGDNESQSKLTNVTWHLHTASREAPWQHASLSVFTSEESRTQPTS